MYPTQIHYTLCHKSVEIIKKYPGQTLKEIPEYPEVQKLWDFMDYLENNYHVVKPKTTSSQT